MTLIWLSSQQVPDLPCGTGLVVGIALLALIGIVTALVTLAYLALKR